MKAHILISLTSSLLLTLDQVHGHGRVLEPASRSSLWRLPEYSDQGPPQNYDDNGLNCGGFSVQHGENGGQCGECGDAYHLKRPRANEGGGGRWARGIIAREYDAGSVIDVFVELTANHMGYFEFRLCPHNAPSSPVMQSCLDQNVLEIVRPSRGTKLHVQRNVNKYRYKLKLPEGLTCSQCVLQWHYSAGNNWGRCQNGTGAVGCGPQETFRSCSDVRIH